MQIFTVAIDCSVRKVMFNMLVLYVRMYVGFHLVNVCAYQSTAVLCSKHVLHACVHAWYNVCTCLRTCLPG